MTERDALLAAIRANSDDDLPRLVYADWLDDNGESLPDGERKSAGDRAAFIRAQVEAARADPFGPAAREASDRANRLLTPIHREQWTWRLRSLVLDAGFVRGFVEYAAVEAARFAEVADALFEAEPVRTVRGVRPDPLHAEYEIPLEPFFRAPQLGRLAALELPEVGLGFDDGITLIDMPHVQQLTALSLRGNPLFPPWLSEFLAGPQMPSLTGLDLADISNLGPAIAVGFHDADHRRFTRLDLSGIAFRSSDLMQALESPCASELEELRIRWDGGQATPGTLTHLDLGWVIPWGRLRLLDLEGQGLGPDGMKAIARHPGAATIRWLGLANNVLGSEGLHMLLDSPNLNPLHLDVRYNEFSAKDVHHLHERFPEALILS